MTKRLLLALCLVWLLGSCRSAPPEAPLDFAWTTWSNAAAGYALEVPDVYSADVEPGGDAVLFRWGRTVPVKIYFLDLPAAAERGLWVGAEPTGTAALAGLPATRYDYTHCDGPFCSASVSFVLEREGRWLALEFHSDTVLNDVNRHILASFVLLPSVGADGTWMREGRTQAGCAPRLSRSIANEDQ